MTIRVFATIALLGALVACAAMWRSAVPDVETAVPGTLAPAVIPPADTVDVEFQSPAAAARVRSDTPAPPSALPRALPREFEQAEDLFAFGQRLQTLADAGDSEARWLLTRVHEYCAGFSRDPVGFARDSALIEGLPLRGARALGLARNRVGARCGRFVPDDALTFVQLVEQRQEAAEAGSLAAEAALLAMGEPLYDDLDYRRDLVGRVQASRDPEAFVALAPAMGVAASGDAALVDTVAGTQAAEFAWQIAACDLGLDCSANGALMTQYCATGGICARDARQDFSSFVRDAAVPRQGAEEMDRMVNSLVEGTHAADQLLGMVMR